MSSSYGGDVSVGECWEALRDDPDCFLVDVRTSAEWNFVGFPDSPEGRRAPVFAEWQSFPSMAVDPGFVRRLSEAVKAAGGSEESRLFFLCRSGARSMASAAAMTGAGFSRCFNVSDGFEGPTDEDGHRGTVAGWKAAGLPWVQK